MIQTYTLPNGLRLVMEKIPAVRSVSLGIWIKAGSKYESIENNGISHFIEHMLFKGTDKRDARDIAEAFDSIGGILNAFTSKEYTCYYAKILDEHISIAFDVLADMFFNSTLEPAELEKESNVILEEIKMYDDTPEELVHDLISQANFGQDSLGLTILGREEVLHRLTADSLRQYMAEHYIPANTVIAVAGNIDEQEIIELVNRYFCDFYSHHTPIKLAKPKLTFEPLLRVKETEQAHLSLGFQGLPLGDPNIYVLAILNNILGGSMSSRLFQEIREERGLAYSVYSYHSSYLDVGTMQIYAGTTPRQLETIYELVINILQNLIKNGVTTKELQNSKEQLKGNLMLSLESTNSRMSRIGKNELLLHRHLNLDEIIERIEAVTREDVHQLAIRLFQHKHSVALVSTLEEFPENIDVERLIT